LEETQTLPDGQNEKKMVQESGRVLTGFYQFTLKTTPGYPHRLWLRVNTGRNLKGMVLQAPKGDHWVQLGLRTQNVASTRHFQVLYFDVPEKWITGDRSVFRITSKTGDEFNLYHLWSYQVESGSAQPLPELLGYPSGQSVGQVSHGLIPQSKDWKSPFVLSNHRDQSALIFQKIGNGYLIRSELALEDSTSLLKALLKPNVLDQLGALGQ
jgi:hypothetical protein